MKDQAGIAALLSSGLQRRDQAPNKQLAHELASAADPMEIGALVGLLTSGTRAQKHDAIVVTYEIAETNPALLTPHFGVFLTLLKTKDNRMIWGTLAAIDAVCDLMREQIMVNINLILDAADRSSVIAKDKTMSVLAKLNAEPRFSTVIKPVLLQRLAMSAVNQFPMYAEMTARTLDPSDKDELIRVINQRAETISYPAKIKRLNKLLSKLGEPH